MLKIAIVVFRECVEISLLLGIIMAITKKVGNSRLYITAGLVVGMVGASLFAFFTQYISFAFAGMGEEVFDSAIIILTVILISWTIIWMKGYESELRCKLADISNKINDGFTGHLMLVLVVAATILREGAEIILLIYGISSAEKISVDDYLIGFCTGALSGLLLGSIIYLGLVKFAGKYIFKISSFLLIFIAAGLASQAAAKLTSIGVITVLLDQLWDSSWLVSDHSYSGKLLNTVIGYNAKPNGMQLVFYAGTIFLITVLMTAKNINTIRNRKLDTKC
ncbi:MAG: FTR1 family iron permease [Janthinobacterium lividum]